MKKNGFTLVELIMVVVVAGIITVFAIPNYIRSSTRAHEKSDINNLLLIRAASMTLVNSGETITTGEKELTDINTALRLSIPAFNGQTYSYWKQGTPTQQNFLACSYRNEASPQAGDFSICITHAPLSATNPGCNRTWEYAALPCPTLADRP